MRKTKTEQNTCTKNFLKKYNPKLKYENIDFLTIRIDICPLARTLNGLVENSDTLILDHGFKITYFGLVAGSQLKVLHILDVESNLVAYVHLKQATTKKNKNFHSDIEFVGLFWTAYADYFEYFANLFSIDADKSNIVSRIDYCFDFVGLTVKDFTDNTRDLYKKSHMIRYADAPTYTNSKGDRHDLCLYDKKLDILEKAKHKVKVGSSRPYLSYLKHDEPITRVEFRKKSRAIKELVDNSINGLRKYIRQQACDYFAKIYDLDLCEILSSCNSPLSRLERPERIDKLNKGISHKKSQYYLTMTDAYADNYTLLNSEGLYFDHLIMRYGSRLLDHCSKYRLEKQTLLDDINQIYNS